MRLGLHVNNKLAGTRRQRFLQYVDQVRPEAVKFLADGFEPYLADYCHERGVKVIGRRVSSCEGGRPHGEVMAWIREHRQWLDYAENCNEVHEKGDEFRMYCRKSLEWMRECEAVG
jgi:hypothetical protein